MEPIFKFGCDLHEMIVIKLQIMLTLIIGADVHGPVGHTKVEKTTPVEVSSDAECLQDEGAFEACADVDDGVVGEQLHSD